MNNERERNLRVNHRKNRRLTPKERSLLKRKVRLSIIIGGKAIEFIRTICSALDFIGSIYAGFIAISAIYNWLMSENRFPSIFFFLILLSAIVLCMVFPKE